MTLEVLYGIVCATTAAPLLWSRGQIQRFLSLTPVIADRQGLQRYRTVARKAIYAPMLSVIAEAAAAILGFVLVRRDGWVALGPVLFATLVLVVLRKFHDGAERRALAVGVDGEGLEDEHRRARDAWSARQLERLT
jgi:hypothetical protein